MGLGRAFSKIIDSRITENLVLIRARNAEGGSLIGRAGGLKVKLPDYSP